MRSASERWGVKCGLYLIISNWLFLIISSLTASIFFLQPNRQLKLNSLACCFWNFTPMSLKACDCLVNDVNCVILLDFCDFSSVVKWVLKQPSSFAIKLSWTIITESSHFLEQRVAIIQFTIVLLKNLLLFPPEQLHFIIAFCVSTRSIFSIYSLHTCPRRAVCVRLFFVGLTLSRIHTATHRGPLLHPPRSPWKPTFSCQRPFQCGLFKLTSFRPPVSVLSCVLGFVLVASFQDYITFFLWLLRALANRGWMHLFHLSNHTFCGWNPGAEVRDLQVQPHTGTSLWDWSVCLSRNAKHLLIFFSCQKLTLHDTTCWQTQMAAKVKLLNFITLRSCRMTSTNHKEQSLMVSTKS